MYSNTRKIHSILCLWPWRVNPEHSLERLMLRLKLQYFGHLMQRADSLEKTLMLEKIEGKRRRGWQKMRWLDSHHWLKGHVVIQSLSWTSDTLATWCEELTHWKRPWCWKRLKVGGEGDDRGWDGWMASPTQWTWDWVYSGSWWWTGRPGVLQFMGSQRVGHDLVTELNWTEWHKNSHINQWNRRIKCQEINLCTYSQYLTEELSTLNGEKIVFSTNDAGKTGYAYVRQWNWTPIFHHSKN